MTSLPLDPTARRGLARRLIAGAALAAAGVATPPGALAGPTDIANAPIASAATATVPPNVLFILDGSGSMNSEFMPDAMGSYDQRASYASHLCNTIYYNPATTYLAPKNADGSDFANSSFTAADNDGFLNSSSIYTGNPSSLRSDLTTNLSSGYKGTDLSGTERAFYYKWTGASAPTTSECESSAPSANRSFPHATGSWTKVQIPDPADPRPAAEQEQNFANWFTYYRTRMLLMKSAAGRAFNGLTDKFRVGFVTICPNGSSCNDDNLVTGVTSAYYLKIDAFTPTHKSAWYSKFYSQTTGGYTPLRQALARAGRHFGGRTDGINSGMPDDPIQYSCQQNFSILTTDGYWNYGKGKTLTNGTSGTGDIGNHDNVITTSPRPMFDSGPINQVVVTTNNQERYQSRSSGSPSCTSSSLRKRYETRVETITVTTPQFGSPSTSTSVSSTTSTNVCSTAPATSSWTTISSTTSAPSFVAAGSTANTLADVAAYYYQTDLRGPGSIGALGTDVGTNNNVPPSGTGVEDDKATHQHMTTFTLGLGLDGQLTYDPNYKSATVGDFADIRAGVKGWPNPNPSNPNTGSTTEQMARIDDLWHAAVNGRGQYFSAKNPTSLALSLQTALTAIQTRLASAAAAATSTLEPTTADNLIILPTYVTNEWSGELEAYKIDVTPGSPTFGEVLPTLVWSAKTKLDALAKAACDNRKIKLFRAGAIDNMVDFTWDSQACDTGGLPTGTPSTVLDSTEQAFFTAAGGTDEVTDLSQYSLMTEDGPGPLIDQQTAARGANLVNFIRGHRGKEGFAPNTDRLYRTRKHVLGDIVNSQPLYVRTAAFSYADPGYASFASTVSTRKAMVYVAANDGMLHAFDATDTATGGSESWAFIPRAVLPRLYKLADNNYANLHEYYVDGRPARDDVYDVAAGKWRTVLVGGLNKGGRAYYALDITDPDAPIALWEFAATTACWSAANKFSDCDLGLTFGNPVITKLLPGTSLSPTATYPSGRWVVLVTSGYNNVAPGNGQGYLYILDVITGEILDKIGTGAGDTATPSGLAKITAWVNDAEHNNTTLRVYGVDLLGNVWRFDINDEKDGLGLPVLPPAGREATRIATVKDSGGVPQPITVAPRLSEVGSPPQPFLFVGTGRYLGTTDVANTQVQSIYAIRDPLTTTAYADLRISLNQMQLTAVGTDRFVACNTASPAACTSADGWYVDLIEPGERVNVNMELQLGTLVVASNVPANTACEPGGFSFINFFDITSGFSPAGTTAPVGYRTAGLTVGLSIVRLPDGSVVVYRQRSDPPPGGGIDKEDVPIASGAPTGKRTTWREILP